MHVKQGIILFLIKEFNILTSHPIVNKKLEDSPVKQLKLRRKYT
jgi:hypothetical protein